jgi:hypothetical protein
LTADILISISSKRSQYYEKENNSVKEKREPRNVRYLLERQRVESSNLLRNQRLVVFASAIVPAGRLMLIKLFLQ